MHICSNAWLNVKDDKGEGKPTLTIGDGTYIGRSVQINAWQNVVIEDHVLIADRVYISDADHIFEKSTKPIMLSILISSSLILELKPLYIKISTLKRHIVLISSREKWPSVKKRMFSKEPY